MKSKIIKGVLAGIMATGVYMAAAQDSRDVKFAQHAAKDGMMEVKLGQLAQTNATASDVKMHAQHMIDDHSKANEELKSTAGKKNISLPTSIGDKMQKKYDKLAKLNGKEFDKKYSKCMVHAHKKAICLFKKEAKKGKDTDLKTWASDKIPTLKSHLKMWKETRKTV